MSFQARVPGLRSLGAAAVAGALLALSNAVATSPPTHGADGGSSSMRNVAASNPLSAESLGLLPHMYSLLQLSNRIADTHELTSGMHGGVLSTGEMAMNADGTASAALIAQAGQFFELIEDPLLNLLVPVLVKVIMGVVRAPIINVLCDILGAVLAQLLAEPFGSVTYPGVDVSPLMSVVQTMKPMSPAGQRMMSTSTTTTSEETVESFFLQLGEQGSGSSSRSGLDDTTSSKLSSIVESLASFLEVDEAAATNVNASSEGSPASTAFLPLFKWKHLEASSVRVEVLERADELIRQRTNGALSLDAIREMAEERARASEQEQEGATGEAEEGEDEEEQDEAQEGFAEEETSLPSWDAPHPGLHLDDLWAHSNQDTGADNAESGIASYASFLELHTASTPCSAAKTRGECLRMAPPVMLERGCSWCHKAKGDPTAGKCVPCDAKKVKNAVKKGGMACSPDANACATRFQSDRAKRPLDYTYHLTKEEKRDKEEASKRAKWELLRPRAYESSGVGVDKKVPTPSPTPTPSRSPSPSPSSSALPKGLVPHNAERKDWQPDDETRFPKPPPPITGKPPENEAAQQIVRTITDDVAALMSHTLRSTLVPRLRKTLTDKLSRFTVRQATATVTEQVVRAMHSPPVPMGLLEGIALEATRDLSAEATQVLTEALVPSIAEAISRNPGMDLLCFLCRSEAKVYCEACQQGVNADLANSEHAWAVATEQAIKARQGLLHDSGIVEAAVAKSIEQETDGVIAAEKGSKKRKKF